MPSARGLGTSVSPLSSPLLAPAWYQWCVYVCEEAHWVFLTYGKRGKEGGNQEGFLPTGHTLLQAGDASLTPCSLLLLKSVQPNRWPSRTASEGAPGRPLCSWPQASLGWRWPRQPLCLSPRLPLTFQTFGPEPGFVSPVLCALEDSLRLGEKPPAAKQHRPKFLLDSPPS